MDSQHSMPLSPAPCVCFGGVVRWIALIAPLRDAGVIIASCFHGYKIPTCIDDIYAYANQTNGIVRPMLNRIQKCRQLILFHTDGSLDIFDDPVLKKYKRYFGDY